MREWKLNWRRLVPKGAGRLSFFGHERERRDAVRKCGGANLSMEDKMQQDVQWDCERCGRAIQQSPSAPIAVRIRDPEFIGPDGVEVHFCCWGCAALWFNTQAGEILMPDLDSDFFITDRETPMPDLDSDFFTADRDEGGAA
jgi:hypothetical protein